MLTRRLQRYDIVQQRFNNVYTIITLLYFDYTVIYDITNME